ncbi:hypothetical protein C7999DRAFT_16031, partial [Corynascus novoguineensis]
RIHLPRPLGNLVIIIWAAVSLFARLSITGALNLVLRSFQARGVPTVTASFVRFCHVISVYIHTLLCCH